MTLADRLHRALCRTGAHLWGKPRVNQVRICRICRKRVRVGGLVRPTQSDRIALREGTEITDCEFYENGHGVKGITLDFDEVRRSRKLRPEDFPAVTQGPTA